MTTNYTQAATHKKILLVEDEVFIRDIYERTLIKAGARVSVASDGEEGVKKATEELPDLILLDILMPKVNGLEALAKLKENPKTKSIPVVLLTNLGQSGTIKEAFKKGASGYLMKMKMTPYDMVDNIKKFLDDPKFKMDYNSLVDLD